MGYWLNIGCIGLKYWLNIGKYWFVFIWGWFICLLLLKLKMSITISDWGFICKYKRYARKLQNDATTSQIIFKIPTWGEWSDGLRHCKWMGRFLIKTRLCTLPGLGNQPRCTQKAPSDLSVGTWINAMINIWWVTLSP